MDSIRTDDVNGASFDASVRRLTRRDQQKAEQKARTRLRLLEAAIDVYIEEGPANASLASVAAHAGVSNATLFFHFGSRMDLMDQLVQHLLATRFDADAERHQGSDLHTLMKDIIAAQRRPEVRLLWQLGDLIQLERPYGPNAAYWGLVVEIEKRLDDEGHTASEAHRLAIVLAPALMLVARRAAFDLTTASEIDDFIAEACGLADRLGVG